MINLCLAVLFSVLVSVLLKVAKRKQIVIEQAIAFNYVMAGSLAYFLLRPDFEGMGFNLFLLTSKSMPIFFALGFLLPTVFIIMAMAVNFAGIVRSDSAQRLSLFLPIVASVVIFGQVLNEGQIWGLGLAFFALFCLLAKPIGEMVNHRKGMLALLLVWLGYGVIDILFKQVAKMGGAFPNTLFTAFVLAGSVMFIYLTLKRTQWTIASVVGGLALGALNFGNILFYIKAHQSFSANPALVFAGMNMGVMILGTLVGRIGFKEKMSKVNYLGVLLGLLAISCLFYW